MYNYFASTITERMGLAPKVPFVGAKGQFEGVEERWKKANRTSFAYLEYNPTEVNGNALPPPQRVGATPMEAALLQQMQVIEHDVQTSLGMFKAATGESESQQSGRAILALQRESDTGTYHFGANQGVSIRHAGVIIVDLIPHYYDAKRIVRIMGEDGDVQTATIDPGQEEAMRQVQTPEGMKSIFNPGVGKYDVSISVGPSYNTKRMEAQATFVELAKGATDPISAAVLRYLTVKNSDFDKADEAAKMLRALLPPPVLQALSGNEQIPPVAQAMLAQAQQQVQALSQELQQEQAGTKQAAMKVQADHDAKMKALALEEQVQKEKARLAREQAAEEARLARKRAEDEMNLKRFQCEQENDLADLSAGAEHERETKKIALQKEKQDADRADKLAAENEDEAEKVAPQLMDTMKAIVEQFGKIIEQQNKFNAALIERLDNPKPREITLGGIQRGPDGISKATAVVH
jgi:hypothetical protein